MNRSPGTASLHQSDIDNGSVMITRILSDAEYGGQCQETSVSHLRDPRVTTIDDPIQQRTNVRVELEQKNDRFLSQGVDLLVLGGEQDVQPRVDVTVAVFRQSLSVETGTAAEDGAHGFHRRQLQFGGLQLLAGTRCVQTEWTSELAAPAGEQDEYLLAQFSFQQTRPQFHFFVGKKT